MPTPANGRPTDELLIEAARAHVTRLYGPSRAPSKIKLYIEGVPGHVTLPVPPAPAPASVWVPSDVQACVLEALAGKSLRTKELARAAGVSERDLFRHPGGLRELQDRGDVVNHKRLGYFRPDDPPQDVDLQ
jgi:hypothetical protein